MNIMNTDEGKGKQDFSPDSLEFQLRYNLSGQNCGFYFKMQIVRTD